MKRSKEMLVVGHRGARGLKPENTIPAFLEALSLGAKGLEMDLYLTKEGEVVVAHDATISAQLCLTPEGDMLEDHESKQLKIYELYLDQIKPFDCGTKENPDFPRQDSQKAHIPTLQEVISAVKLHAKEPVKLFLEIKSSPSTDHVYHPKPKAFVEKVLKVIFDMQVGEQVVVESFDKRCLQEVKRQADNLAIGVAIEESMQLQEEIRQLTFEPAYVCVLHKLINEEFIKRAREGGMQVVAWTVNETDDIKRMIELGVDGIITDYPDKVLSLIERE